MSSQPYTPGVCNLNTVETKRRWRGAYVGIALYVTFFVLVVFVQDVYLLRIFMFFPALIFSIYFVQARNHFCVAYGTTGKSNAQEGSAKPVEVTEADAIAADKANSKKLIIIAIEIAAVMT